MPDALSTGLATLEFSRSNLLSFMEDIPADQMCHQPVEGGNHTLWIAGHLAQTDDFFLTALAGRAPACPASYRTLFGMGSQPVNDPAAYPCLDDIKAQLDARRTDLVAWLKSLSLDQLAAPLTGDLAGFAPAHVALAGALAWHEGLHTGQLTFIRKSLGIGPKFG